MAERRAAGTTTWMLAGLVAGTGGVACGGPQGQGEATSGSTGEVTSDDASVGSDSGGPDGFGPEQTFELRLNDDLPPPLVLDMSRDEVAELFGDRADEVLLLELDSSVLLTEALEQIKDACGQFWREDDPNPDHDCSLTPLGQTFVGPDGTWRSSAEYALVRILTMTPANVVVEGTSSEGLQGLSDALGIGGGYGQILADALGIPRTSPVVSTAGLVQSFKENFVASHPNVGASGKLSITLADALSDLATLADRYGPVGDHPGIVDPSFVPSGAVLGPDFHMRAVAQSNLQLCDGIDADAGKGFISVIADKTGPTYEDELEFDFTNPADFELGGLIDNPTVDLRFRTTETVGFVPSCLGDPPCQDNAPGSPQGGSSVWGLDPWLLEYNVTAGARNDYIDRTFLGGYLFNTAHVLIGQGGNPPGWVEYDIPLNLGSPPDPQYVWETILEVAQVALHETPYASIPEGQANVAFTLFDVPVGITGPEAAQAVRPYLQEQASVLSDFLLGDYKKNNDPVDFYYRRAEGGVPYLFFVNEKDLPDGQPYAYGNPGFFDDPALTQKRSSTQVAGVGDTTHEKLALVDGVTTVYFQDDGGITWRARFELPTDDDTIAVHLARKE
ncbi:MAG: hypothetical protein IPH07_12725 [Deltaproteobacteria bacterium]|jgi:hypothetical protein|nr:hypothetical protein [Deltaproteobacteria bacterium]MBK8241347.1 hypothetical protein [Deltaproteobacteria bacterium]MBK8717063.1 hypothetical protein [Deltaproteobacteria bacterium]MBP7286414.1 hypothetical protein [Nannocystaceae bacterium]